MKSKTLSYQLEKLLFFLTVLFLPTQLGKHFWPDFASVYSLRIDYLSPTIYFWDLLVLSLVSTWLYNLFRKHSRDKVNKTAFIILFYFFLTQVVSIFFSENPGGGLVRLKEYATGILFGLYLASANFAQIKKFFLSGLLIAVVFSCLLGIAQFLAGSSLGLWIVGERDFSVTTPLIAKFDFYDRVFLRPYATFSHPNMLAGFLAATLPILLVGLDRSLLAFKLMLSLLITSTVFITFSRPGVALIGLQVAVLFKRFWKLLLILSVLTAPLIFVRFTSVFTYDQLAVLRREELSEFAINAFYSRPILGIGLNNFVNNLASNEVLVGTSRFLQPVHDIFLLSLSETGLVGFAGFLVLLLTALIKNLKTKTPLSQALTVSLLSIVFLGLFDHYFLTLPQGQRVLFMIIGLSLMETQQGKT